MNSELQSEPQSALDVQTSGQETPPTRPRVFKRVSLQPLVLGCLGVVGTGSLLALVGCPANLEDPQRFNVTVAVGGGGPAGGNGAAGTNVTVDTTCLTQVFAASCALAGCHLAGTPAADLDLSSPNVAARLINVSATHKDAGPACMPAKLVDTTNPSASWLLAKINGTQGSCGSPMPIGPALLADAKACINTFVTAAAAAVSGSTTGTQAGSGGATSSAGNGGNSAAGTSAGSGGT